ncbi:MAG: polysaccharide deacetylase family protein [Verrucomicrobiota bacterium]
MHLVTLGFDDGFLKSNLKIAEIFEKHHLAACFNVIATGNRTDYRPPDQYQVGPAKGDFSVWNELRARGHEIQPHGYRHANKAALPFAAAQTLIQDCLAVFQIELAGFNPRQAVFAFPYSATTPELEQWLPTVVRAFRAGGSGFNPLPHPQLTNISTTAFGPGNCDQHLDAQVTRLLSQPAGWLVYTGHGLADEGWGPMSADYLDNLLGRLTAIPTVKVLPPGAALRAAGTPIQLAERA